MMNRRTIAICSLLVTSNCRLIVIFLFLWIVCRSWYLRFCDVELYMNRDIFASVIYNCMSIVIFSFLWRRIVDQSWYLRFCDVKSHADRDFFVSVRVVFYCGQVLWWKLVVRIRVCCHSDPNMFKNLITLFVYGAASCALWRTSTEMCCDASLQKSKKNHYTSDGIYHGEMKYPHRDFLTGHIALM